ncbi:LAFA_0G00650g1_1 [Lachancea sp. 'fantastica']|nr:LAFA_0G00650g1_1 [Lachancea sp. 'fantastica']
MQDTDLVKEIAALLQAAEEDTTCLSEQVLQDQETHYAETVEQLQRSAQQLVEDNEFLFETVDPNAEINPRSVSVHILEVSKLAERLKNTHLEQEMLDNFLRYTLPSGDLLQQIETPQDERYVSLEKNVVHLQDVVITQLESEVDQLREEISHTSQKIADQREVVNELCLNTGELVDECHALLEELESNDDNAKVASPDTTNGVSSTEATIQQLHAVKETVQEKKHFEQRLEHLQRTKKSLNAIENSADEEAQDQDSGLAESYTAYRTLIEYWRSQFFDSEVRNLEVLPKSNKVQFTYYNLDVVVQLNASGVSEVELYGSNMPLDKLDLIRKRVNDKQPRDIPIYLQFKNVLNIIKENAIIV